MQTISQVEAQLQSALESLRELNLRPETRQALNLLLPEGLQPVVQLEEDGRKKRSSADASNWNPRTGEIRIYFDPITPSIAPQAQSHVRTPAITAPPTPSTGTFNAEVASPQQIVECCQALAEAEKSNRQFIALTWFRDDYLATVDFTWAKTAQGRQRVLACALEMGRIQAKKIPNPKSTFPTTTISLNRSIPTPGVAPRFQPIAVRGEPVSTTLMRDRGNV